MLIWPRLSYQYPRIFLVFWNASNKMGEKNNNKCPKISFRSAVEVPPQINEGKMCSSPSSKTFCSESILKSLSLEASERRMWCPNLESPDQF
ncbi:hypothetical protein CEXT_287901 [Caerostris extrusa]|uniref:Uncharacterized protein n=1 Tax=Caerostris extrusa TaxID=172846 RepID=A0AAV4UYC0_CAEEX|nr:hypothetical protein CEXT_287901 [Caerostris extrusa]